MSIRSTLVAATLGLATFTATAYAQDQGGAPPPPPGGQQGGQQGGQDNGGRGNRRGNWDPAQMQQRMMEGLKEQLKAQEDEWKVLEPKLAKVMEAQRDMRFGGGMGFGGRGGPGGGRDNNPNPDQPQSELQKAGRDLRTTLQNDGASASDIEAKLKSYREARDKAQETLKAAREDLKGVLTQRQEAVLVMAGMLE